MRFRAVLVALVAVLVLAPQADAAGPNLLPNPGFEAGVNGASAEGVDQPLLPVGWVFEGVAGLFDHTPSGKKSGRYSAAISIPASGKQRVCPGTEQTGTLYPCQQLTPVNDAKNTAATYYSVAPAWRPQAPVAVRAGTKYTVSGWVTWTFVTLDEGGSLVRVRWLDADGVPIKTDIAYRRIAKTLLESNVVNWTAFSGTVTAPPGAAQAVPLFGMADDAFNSNLKYDDVSFHTA